MKYTNKKQIFSKTDYFKSLIIVFGTCLGLLTISSFDNWKSSDEQSIVQGTQEIKDCALEAHSATTTENCNLTESRTIIHHNFIASYLLQESSFERKNKKSKIQSDLFSHLKQLHKIIITQTLGSI